MLVLVLVLVLALALVLALVLVRAGLPIVRQVMLSWLFPQKGRLLIVNIHRSLLRPIQFRRV